MSQTNSLQRVSALRWLVPVVFLLAALGFLTPTPALAGVCPADPENGGPSGVTLDECVTSTHFVIYYTTDSADSPHNIDSESEAQTLANNLEFAWDRYKNDPDFALRESKDTASKRLEVWVYDIPYLGVTSNSWNHMEIDASFVRGSDTSESDRLQNEATPLHELFHRVEYRYGNYSSHGSWAVEGQAKFMEDQVFADLDDAANTQYLIRSNGYLGNPNWDVTTASYNASLFWKYFTERYGTATQEPERGVDAIRHFWEAGEGGAIGTNAVTGALNALGHSSVNFSQVFRDWIAANYTKKLATVPDAKYGYIDDDGASPDYAAVALTVNTSVGPGTYTTSADQAVDRWGAKYFKISPTASCQIINMQFARDSGTPVYHILAIKDDALSHHWTSTSYNFSKTLVNDDYDEIVGIVGGYGSDTQVDVSYGCLADSDLHLNIVSPLETAPAFVGSILSPDKFLVRLEVTSTQNIQIEGLQAQDFDVLVDSAAADIVTGAYIQSQYWLLVQAPVQGAAGVYNLTASFGAATDTENNAVNYITVLHDDMLVIDRSGSMSTNDKFGAAKNAARLYADATANNNKLGLVSFTGNGTEPNEDATLNHGLATVNSAVRDAIKTQINGLTLGNLTSIGDGLWTAYQELQANGDPEHPCIIVLLSDGIENEARLWSTIKPTIVGSDCVVNTIALGPSTNEALMQDIAYSTGGSYHFVPDGSGVFASGAGNPQGDWRNELGSTYEYIQGDVAGRSRLFQVNDSLSVGQTVTYTAEVENDVAEATFFVNVFQAGANLNFGIYTPAGVRINCEEPGVECFYDFINNPGHALIRVGNPTLQPGTWQIVVSVGPASCQICAAAEGASPQVVDQGGSVEVLVGVSGVTPKLLLPAIGAAQVDRFQGARIPILAILAGQQPILNAQVSATVLGPGGLQHVLTLYDDGQHGDGSANDGIYGNFFQKTKALSPQSEGAGSVLPDGSYQVKIESQAVPGEIGDRFAQTSFAIQLDADNDSDGMPNHWEDANGLDKNNPDDADDDPDLDGLDNLGEYNASTDPFNSDSDGGGENDGSEVDFAQDPLDPADDEIEAIDPFNAKPLPQAVALTYGTNPDYNRLRLFRSTTADSGFLPINNDIGASGAYTDTGLTNETTYYYRLMAVDGDGHRSAVSPVRAATPKVDPFPPVGGQVLINDNADSTTSRNVVLHFLFEEPLEEQDVAEVQISNDPTLEGKPWVTYQPTLTWTLSDSVQPGELATVYVRFRDAAENVAEDIAGDSIRFEAGGANQPPVAVNDTATATADGAVTIDVLANDTDPDGDLLTLTIVTPPANGTAVVDNGQIIYTPNAGFVGSDSFTYSITDGKGGSAIATVSLTVNQSGGGSDSLYLPLIQR
jgi:hypothetical protein